MWWVEGVVVVVFVFFCFFVFDVVVVFNIEIERQIISIKI